MIPVQKALKLLDHNIQPLGTERVGIGNSIGRILAEDIIADSDLPPFNRSQMDGYAVRSRDTRHAPVTLKIVGESAAGRGWHKDLKRGEAIRIMTGAPVPAGADAVEKIELTKEYDSLVSFIDPVAKGQFIIEKGKEIRLGEVVIAAGRRVTPEMIATPAAFGYSKIKVAKQPTVTIIPTGAEIVGIGKKPKRDQIRDSNSISLASLSANSVASVYVGASVGDDLEQLGNAIDSAAKVSDIVVTTGGVSVGKYDLTKRAMASIGARIIFDKVALRPGKPTVFARRGKKYFFGLPGNPVSAAVTFLLFVRRAIMLMQSATDPAMQRGFAVLNSPLRGTKSRDVYFPARLASSADGKLIAVPLPWIGSSDLVSFANAEALVIVPKLTTFNEGDVADVLFL
ncbi:MAG: molybdopterin molybdenumtransferase MoeA [Acidobacteria bacterium]|nr:MAG: molybdopterin molybdenumtransferase MoeA [Acidobacteriota bacterium]